MNLKILFTTDLHGSEWKYDRLLETAQEYKADVVVIGGDMLPKERDLFTQDRFIGDYLDNHFGSFDDAGIYYLCYLGNDDLGVFDQVFAETCSRHTHVVNLAQRKIDINDYEFVGMNWVVDYPFRLKDRCRMDTESYVFQRQYGKGLLSTVNGWRELEDWFAYVKTLPTIEEELEKLERPEKMSQCIYVFHMPPYRLDLDVCWNGEEVGSRAIFEFLQKHQPRLSLHGHIHESPEYRGKWHARLGNTICIQPGQLSPFAFVTVDLQTMQFDRHVVES